MNRKFQELPKEKQERIILAGMEIFGKNGYKKALTDDIAHHAGISKGLLFHYFKDKKSFYLYIFDYCEKIVRKNIKVEDIKNIDDFFDLIDYGAEKKLQLIKKHPYMVNFVLKAYLSHKEAISDELNIRIQNLYDSVYDEYFQYIDFYKFKDNINPKDIYHMMVWMAEGYLVDKQRFDQPFDIDVFLIEFQKWKKMFKTMCYKEEYL